MSEEHRLDEENLNAAQREMEQTLRRLKPVPQTFSAEGMMAQAIGRAEEGRRAAARHMRIWRGVTVGLAALLALVAWVRRPTPSTERIIVKVVHEAPGRLSGVAVAPVPGIAAPSTSSCAYLILRRDVFQHGLAGLPQAPHPSATPAPALHDRAFERALETGGGA